MIVDTNVGGVLKKNKGFTVHINGKYIGYLTLNEKKVPADNIAKLQVPENMKFLLSQPQLELRPYAEKEAEDMTDVMDLISEGEKARILAEAKKLEDDLLADIS